MILIDSYTRKINIQDDQNKVLGLGEIASWIETVNGISVQKLKIGDGSTAFKNLPEVIGEKGVAGTNGITPHIGDNGNWFIGTTDTGVKAQGEKGDKGDTGAQGPQGPQGPAGAGGSSIGMIAVDPDKNSITVGTSEVPDAFSSYISGPTNAPSALGESSCASGVNAVANSTGSIALGAATTAGVKGYYWSDVTSTTIKLSLDQHFEKWPTSTSIDWQAGDIISIVNDSKYPYCATIKSVAGNTITVDSLPFSKSAYNFLENFVLMPDDKTVFAVRRDFDETTNRSTITVRNGSVELGWAAFANGIQTVSVGAASQAFGWNNISAGDFGATFGRDNVAGYAGFTSGWNNINTGTTSAAFGNSNKITASHAFAAGQHNTIRNGNGVAFGYNNNVNGASAFVAGDGNTANNWCQAVVGKYCDDSTTSNALFVVGNGSADKKSNAFTVKTEGLVQSICIGTDLGEDSKGDKYPNTFVNADGKQVQWSAAIGRNHTVAANQSLAVGYSNTNSSSCTLTAGEGLTTKTWCQSVFGKYNKTDSTSVAVFGWGTSSSRKNAATIKSLGSKDSYSVAERDTDLVTLGFLKTYTPANGVSFPTTAADGSALKEGAILVYKDGAWKAENPPTSVYIGEVE